MRGVGAVLLQVQQLQAQAFTGRARSHAGRVETLQGLQGGLQLGREIGGGKSPDGRGIVGVLASRSAMVYRSVVILKVCGKKEFGNYVIF